MRVSVRYSLRIAEGADMRSSLRLGRVAGVPVSLNWSVLVVTMLLTWQLGAGLLPQEAPGHGMVAYWGAGLAGAILLLGSLLAHELAHSLVARRHGVEVEGLTLWMFGGVTTLRGSATTPRADLQIAGAGPAASFALAFLFGDAAVAFRALDLSGVLVVVAAWLAAVNLVLAVFNLVPGAPLDGGRILRAVLWRHSGDRAKAAATASRAGEAIGYGLFVLGLIAFLAGDTVGGLWTVFIGWFILASARAEYDAEVSGRVLGAVTVREVMTPHVQTADAGATVAQFVEDQVVSGRHSAYPVVDRLGRVEGLVTLQQLRRVPSSARATTLVRQVCVPPSDVVAASPADALTEVVSRMSDRSGRRVLVLDGGRLVGIVTPADVSRTLAIRELALSAGHAGRGPRDRGM
jgi:Zn-dependent protease/predicted transcriptional regulator